MAGLSSHKEEYTRMPTTLLGSGAFLYLETSQNKQTR